MMIILATLLGFWPTSKYKLLVRNQDYIYLWLWGNLPEFGVSGAEFSAFL